MMLIGTAGGVGIRPICKAPVMFDVTKMLANALGEHLALTYQRTFGSREPRFAEVIEASARLTFERIVGSDALYHDSDHTALVTLVAQDILRGRFLDKGITPEFPDLKRRAIALHERWRSLATLVEDKGSGTSLLQEMRATGLPAIPFQPSGDKVMRMHAQSVRFEAQSVYLPRAAPWLDELVAELLAFPAGRHDDQVDSISQALEWAAERRTRPQPRIRRL